MPGRPPLRQMQHPTRLFFHATRDSCKEFKQKTILPGEGPPPPGASLVGSAEEVLNTQPPALTNSKLKGFVFDMNVLLLDVTSKKGITAVGGWDSWNTQPGVKGLLTYLHTRGLKAGLLPSFDIVGKPGLVEKGIAALSDQVQYKFNHVMENNPPSASKQKLSVFSSNIDSLQSKWGVRKEEIMVFSMDEELIATAKEREYFTCALKVQNKNWQAARAADYSVKNMNDVKLVIEELNGISFRNRELFFNRK